MERNLTTIQQCLDSELALHEDLLLNCPECGHQHANKLSRFVSVPKVLVVVLKRFRANAHRSEKITQQLTNYSSLQIPCIDTNITFNLVAAVYHKGASIHSGLHYCILQR